ncbi:hypothetical protein O4H61_19725 [Roseovarius aestuarii]|nr:hypothetical protein [Roseovarius aestuarii]
MPSLKSVYENGTGFSTSDGVDFSQPATIDTGKIHITGGSTNVAYSDDDRVFQNDSSSGLIDDQGDPNQLIPGTDTRIYIDGVMQGVDTATGTTYTIANIETYDSSGNVDGAYLMFFADQGSAPASIDMSDAVELPTGTILDLVPDSWSTSPTVLNPLDDIVTGSSGDDEIDEMYTGDPEGDRSMTRSRRIKAI